jgi:hypothetical protein
VGKINDFTIKPIEQHSYFLSGFSRHTLLTNTIESGYDNTNATRTPLQDSKTVNAIVFISQGSKLSSSDNDKSGLSDRHSDLSSEDNECLSKVEQQGSSSTKIKVRWDPLDEQRLVAWKKEGMFWDLIYKRFPHRTPSAICARWNKVKNALATDDSKEWLVERILDERQKKLPGRGSGLGFSL